MPLKYDKIDPVTLYRGDEEVVVESQIQAQVFERDGFSAKKSDSKDPNPPADNEAKRAALGGDLAKQNAADQIEARGQGEVLADFVTGKDTKVSTKALGSQNMAELRVSAEAKGVDDPNQYKTKRELVDAIEATDKK